MKTTFLSVLALAFGLSSFAYSVNDVDVPTEVLDWQPTEVEMLINVMETRIVSAEAREVAAVNGAPDLSLTVLDSIQRDKQLGTLDEMSELLAYGCGGGLCEGGGSPCSEGCSCVCDTYSYCRCLALFGPVKDDEEPEVLVRWTNKIGVMPFASQ